MAKNGRNLCTGNSRHINVRYFFIKDRLDKESRNNVAIQIENTESPDAFKVSGRGELQLAILIETMRREGFEFAVSRPEVLFQTIDGELCEPMEEIIIDVHSDYSNKVIDNLLKRKAVMLSMNQEGENNRSCSRRHPCYAPGEDQKVRSEHG